MSASPLRLPRDPAFDRPQNCLVFVADAPQLQAIGRRDEPEPQRPFMQHRQDIGDDGIMCRVGNQPVECSVEVHQLLAIAGADKRSCRSQDYLHARDIPIGRALDRQPDAIELVDEPCFEDLQHLFERD